MMKQSLKLMKERLKITQLIVIIVPLFKFSSSSLHYANSLLDL